MEYKAPFDMEIEKTEKLLLKAFKMMVKVRDSAKAGDYLSANQEAFHFVESAEQLALQARQLPAYQGNPTAMNTVEDIILKTGNVSMGFTPQNWFKLAIPAILPKKEKGSPEYIRSMLYPVMKNFFRGRQPVKYPDSVIAFRHVYNRLRPERQYRDHDNIEVNMAVDILALYLLPDDAPLKCSHFYCSTKGDADCTEIYVIPSSEFRLWLAKIFGDEPSEIWHSGVPP